MAFRFERLENFRQAMEFAAATYSMSKSFPREEMFGLTANLRRAEVPFWRQAIGDTRP
jgi:hypothetical protein